MIILQLKKKIMTHQEKLNRILYVLLDNHRRELDNQIIDNRLTFSFICNTVAEISDDWEIEFTKKDLFLIDILTFANLDLLNLKRLLNLE